MDNLFDLLRTAQNGHAIDNLAHQFELSRQQAQAAVEALLPAFSSQNSGFQGAVARMVASIQAPYRSA